MFTLRRGIEPRTEGLWSSPLTTTPPRRLISCGIQWMKGHSPFPHQKQNVLTSSSGAPFYYFLLHFVSHGQCADSRCGVNTVSLQLVLFFLRCTWSVLKWYCAVGTRYSVCPRSVLPVQRCRKTERFTNAHTALIAATMVI